MILKSTFFLVLLSEMTQAANTRMSRTSPFFQGDVFHCATGNQEVCSYKDVIWNRDLKASIMPAKLVEPSVTLIEYPEAVPSRFEKRASTALIKPYFDHLSAWCGENVKKEYSFSVKTWGPKHFFRDLDGKLCVNRLFGSIRCGDASAIANHGWCWCGYYLGQGVDSIQFYRREVTFKYHWDGRMRRDFEGLDDSKRKVGLTIDCTNRRNVERTLDKWYNGDHSTGFEGLYFADIDIGVADYNRMKKRENSEFQPTLPQGIELLGGEDALQN